MARRTVNFTYKNTDYSLGYTLATVEQMERGGFVRGELGSKMADMSQKLFYGAFLAEHKNIKRKLVEEIYNNLKDKEGLLMALVELYDEACDALLEEGNVSWTMSE